MIVSGKAVNERIGEFENKKGSLERELKEAKADVLAYQLEAERLQKKLIEETEERSRLSNIVFKQTEELNEAGVELEKTYQFKAYLKSALTS